MGNNDLISRAWVLAEYDRQHKGSPGGARKIMEEAPAVDAVPVVHGRWKAYSVPHWTKRYDDNGDPEYKYHNEYASRGIHYVLSYKGQLRRNSRLAFNDDAVFSSLEEGPLLKIHLLS